MVGYLVAARVDWKVVQTACRMVVSKVYSMAVLMAAQRVGDSVCEMVVQWVA